MDLPDGVVARHDGNDSCSGSEADSGFESNDGVVIGGAEDGAMSFSAE